MRNVPKLRFYSFDEEWEEKKIKNIVEVNLRTEELPDKFIYIDLESVENGILKEKKIIQKENTPSRAKRNVKLNDILYQTVRPYQQNNLFFYFDDEFEYIASTGYAQLRSIKNNPKYIYQLLHTKKFLDKVLENCTGTSYPAINSNDLGNINILYTLNIKEQQKIADFLSNIDKKISITEEKLDLFKDYKKGVMQKIFNQELRFKDSKGNDYPEWEEKKLDDIMKVSSSTISQNTLEDNQGEYIIYGATGEIKKIDFYDKEKEYIGIVKDGAGVGRCFYCEEKSSVLATLNYLDIKENNNLKFCYYILNKIDFTKYIVGSSIPHIYFKDYKFEKIQLPCLEEQEKIANFLSSIDKKIDNLIAELENLKEFKKGLLQQMFV